MTMAFSQALAHVCFSGLCRDIVMQGEPPVTAALTDSLRDARSAPRLFALLTLILIRP